MDVMKMNRSAEESRLWADYEASIALAGFIRRYHRNKTFLENLEDIFSYLCEIYQLLCNYKYGLHIFLNRTIMEVHYLSTSDKIIPNFQNKYNLLRPIEANYWILKKYDENRVNEGSVPPIKNLNSRELSEILKIFGINNIGEHTDGLLIPFNHEHVNMGFFILWEKDNQDREAANESDEAILAWTQSHYAFLQSFLSREYRLIPATYLPSYYSIRWAKAAILFADIRNFTPLTEIIRNLHTRLDAQETNILREILDQYCKEMATIIQFAGKGRVDKFLGDGIMAIFGEHESNHSKIACRATYAATEMVKVFSKIKPDFLKKAFGGEYEIEYNEFVDIELGIGIDYGTILFNYLGDKDHREYTVLGDHVNFAQRLESEAARYDEKTDTNRPPILLSPTAKRCICPWLDNWEEITIHPKGKGRSYKVYGIYPYDFKKDVYSLSENQNDWSTAWKSNEERCGLNPP